MSTTLGAREFGLVSGGALAPIHRRTQLLTYEITTAALREERKAVRRPE